MPKFIPMPSISFLLMLLTMLGVLGTAVVTWATDRAEMKASTAADIRQDKALLIHENRQTLLENNYATILANQERQQENSAAIHQQLNRIIWAPSFPAPTERGP